MAKRPAWVIHSTIYQADSHQLRHLAIAKAIGNVLYSRHLEDVLWEGCWWKELWLFSPS